MKAPRRLALFFSFFFLGCCFVCLFVFTLPQSSRRLASRILGSIRQSEGKEDDVVGGEDGGEGVEGGSRCYLEAF